MFACDACDGRGWHPPVRPTDFPARCPRCEGRGGATAIMMGERPMTLLRVMAMASGPRVCERVLGKIEAKWIGGREWETSDD